MVVDGEQERDRKWRKEKWNGARGPREGGQGRRKRQKRIEKGGNREQRRETGRRRETDQSYGRVNRGIRIGEGDRERETGL